MRKMQLASAVELALLAVEMGLVERPKMQRRMQMDMQKAEAVGVAG